ncbi:MAG: hypothetical protein WC777_06275 [Candidatus Gracilibacteria bacterium]
MPRTLDLSYPPVEHHLPLVHEVMAAPVHTVTSGVGKAVQVLLRFLDWKRSRGDDDTKFRTENLRNLE